MSTALAATMPSLDPRWRAVNARDLAADGTFVYAVTSTGVYCRPSCPSRRPRPDRVAFYPTPTAAEQAGFRACRRCRPEQPRSPLEDKVRRARTWIDAHPDDAPSLARLAKVAATTPWHLQRSFKRLFGLSPREYAAARRTTRLKDALRRERVTDAVYEAGFGSPSRVYEEADATLGMTPGAYRNHAAGERIVFATADSPLGIVLVACTQRGLCRVALGDDAASLEKGLRAEFPRADVRRDAKSTRDALKAVLAVAAGERLADLPLDVRGTAFQRRVWRALQAIPAGSTRTYAEVAEAIGAPTATRAVARACAANPVALVIACHRVVPKAGGTGGYRWGAQRKAALLKAERRRQQ